MQMQLAVQMHSPREQAEKGKRARQTAQMPSHEKPFRLPVQADARAVLAWRESVKKMNLLNVSNRETWGSQRALGLDPGQSLIGRVFLYVMGLVVMSDEKLREMQRQVAKLTESIASMAGERIVPTVGEFAKVFIAEELTSSEHRESTKRAKEYQIRRNIVPAFGHLPMDKMGNVDWNAWIRETKANPRDWRITRYFNVRKLLTELFHKAKARGIIENVPKLDNPDETRNTGRVISDRETWWILRNTTYRIFRVFFYGLYKQGVRPREMLKWERSMIKTAPDGRMWVEVPARITKTARSRLMPVNQTLAKHICRLMKENPDSRFVFQNRIHPDKPQLSYHGAFRTALMKAMQAHPEMKPCVPYDWRRSFITRAMIAGKQPVYIAKLLDTSVPMLERVYTKDDAATLEALVE